MRGRAVRATFLLKTVVLVLSVALFFLVLALASSRGLTIGTLAVLLLFWFIGIEGEVVAALLEHVLKGRAERQGGHVGSLWFIDVDAEHRREVETLRDGVKDNPSLQ